MDSGRGPTRLHNNELTCCTGVPAKNCLLQLQNRLQLTQMYMQKDGTGVVCGECRGTSCSNSSAVEDEDIDDID